MSSLFSCLVFSRLASSCTHLVLVYIADDFVYILVAVKEVEAVQGLPQLVSGEEAVAVGVDLLECPRQILLRLKLAQGHGRPDELVQIDRAAAIHIKLLPLTKHSMHACIARGEKD